MTSRGSLHGSNVGRAFSLEDLAKRHSEFIALSWTGCTPAEIGAKFEECYGMLPIITLEMKRAGVDGQSLYRARWVDPQEDDPEHVQTYSYPRQPDKQIMGRANLPGVPVFYTCGSAPIALKEAHPIGSAAAQLMRSTWKFNDELTWRTAPIIAQDGFGQLDPSFRQMWNDGLREFILKAGNIPQEYVLLLRSFIYELFLSDHYEVSSWIAHRIMQVQCAADVLIYPSSITGQQDLCQAFRAAPIDEGRIVMDQVEQLLPQQERYVVIRKGTANGNTVIWQEGVSEAYV